MDRASLEELGLQVREEGSVVEADLVVPSMLLVNPLTREPIERVTFAVVGDRLLYVGPAEFVGAPPINLAFVTSTQGLSASVAQTLNEHLFQLERRSNELSLIGVPAKVDPRSLQLTADLARGPFRFTIGASRTGQFRVLRCMRGDDQLTSAEQVSFELSEFRSLQTLADYLYAIFSDVVVSPNLPAPEVAELSVSVGQLAKAFGEGGLPARAPVEVLAELRVAGEHLRFVASRLKGRTFRGLLAGPRGKIWAERFEVDQFPGIRVLVARLMKVSIEQVEVVG